MPEFTAACPVPSAASETILLGHGGGGRLSHRLLAELILPAFDNPALACRHDGAVIEPGGQRLAFTTDSYVVTPLRFPGGDIGRLAVHGTVNDLAMCGARAAALSAALIIEEGLPRDTLAQVLTSMRDAAREVGVNIVTGDTKVVERGRGDGLFVTTAGVGVVPPGVDIRPARIAPGDAVILSGDIGRHGIAIMAQREGLAFETTIESDVGDLSVLVADLLAAGVDIHCARDCTRGGLGAALIELAEAAGREIRLREAAVPVAAAVSGACELLGLDPLYVANEGRCVLVVPAADASRVLDILRARPIAAQACLVGSVSVGAPRVILESALGTTRLLDLFSGEQLPRIC